MKLIHISDLHLGKRINEFSMLEDQRYILSQIFHMAEENAVDGILIAGDIYDRSIPSVEAVELFDEFLYRLEQSRISVYIIPGNHDSRERLSFGNRILEKKQIYIQGNLTKQIPYIEKEDEYGRIRIFLLPFFRLAEGRELFSLERGAGYEQVLQCLLDETPLDASVRNLLVTHLFVTPGKGELETSDSERMLSLGGVERVPSVLLEAFDYTALGHIHGPQRVGSDRIRYAGSPLKYSFSEEYHKKSVVLLEIKEKGQLSIQLLPLKPLRDMRRIKGSCKDLMSHEVLSLANPDDYVSIILTDEEEILEPAALLRRVYPNLMQITFSKNEQKYQGEIQKVQMQERTPLELFDSFLEEVRGEKEKTRSDYMKMLLEEMEEDL